ncbi:MULTISPECIES: SRPBCC family protein [unclassified Micromonospora]|uniref:SRPBCC family protein n=1 Tax=unclassified Micromonospora TaxID=2617518 RepID=UPI0010336411|nr:MULTISPECIES: SRPBCC family protein [unclassified Micromonospora]QKW15114.1 SRPBCC family protein [Verrucosispora sp. NA02020]TBL45048.1 SRPBCC family protein [Verrucosispora sp. SN26_14.1]
MVRDVHERRLLQPVQGCRPLIESLAGPHDELWPTGRWPAMRFDRPLGVGAVGGHGPIRYRVEQYEPGQRIRFRFTAPRGFDGFHEYELIPAAGDECVLRHSLVARMRWPAALTYPLIYRPLHAALMTDSLDRAALFTGTPVDAAHRWSRWVRLLRWIVSRVRRRVRAR